MAHGNTANWSGAVQSPHNMAVQSALNTYVIDWEIMYEPPHPLGAGRVEFTIRQGWRGCHVAAELAKKWNENYCDVPAVAYGATVDFSGEVKEMVFRIRNANNPQHTTLPDNHSSIRVVDGLDVCKA